MASWRGARHWGRWGLVLAVLAPALAGLSLPAAAQPKVTDLAWLAGCWAAVGGEAGSGEQWMTPAGGTLFGVSRTVRGGRTVAHELLEIRETGGGTIILVARPSGQPEATFELVKLGPGEVVFENPEHDFPQRILYRRSGEHLNGRIEGTSGGSERAVDYPMERTACTQHGPSG